MPTLRPLTRQAVRPCVYSRYLILSRHQSSAPTFSAVDSNTPPSPPPPPPKPSAFRRYRSSLIWGSLALFLGLGAGQLVMHVLVPPSLPGAGTHQDSVLLEDLEKRIDEEFIVKVLRGKCLGVSKTLKGEQTGWVEIVPPNNTTEGTTPGNGGTLMTALRGANGLGVERIFWSSSEQKLVSIVWFGGNLSGWPGVVHGGLLATALTEKIALANALTHTSTAAAVAATPQRLPGIGSHAKLPLPSEVPGEPAQVSIDYVKPTYAHNFHVIRVIPSYASAENVRMPIQGDEWVATLETLEKQGICVRAAAKFAPRSQVERAKEKVSEGAKWSYQELKERLWPSRQAQSLR